MADDDAARLVADDETRVVGDGRRGDLDVDGIDLADVAVLDRLEDFGDRSLHFVGSVADQASAERKEANEAMQFHNLYFSISTIGLPTRIYTVWNEWMFAPVICIITPVDSIRGNFMV